MVELPADRFLFGAN